MMDFTKRRWLILGASCLVNLCIGSLYAWSVFAAPMAAHIQSVTGGEAPNLSIIFTIANAVGPITMISGGFSTISWGPNGSYFWAGSCLGRECFSLESPRVYPCF